MAKTYSRILVSSVGLSLCHPAKGYKRGTIACATLQHIVVCEWVYVNLVSLRKTKKESFISSKWHRIMYTTSLQKQWMSERVFVQRSSLREAARGVISSKGKVACISSLHIEVYEWVERVYVNLDGKRKATTTPYFQGGDDSMHYIATYNSICLMC